MNKRILLGGVATAVALSVMGAAATGANVARASVAATEHAASPLQSATAEDEKGLLIVQVQVDSPAAKAGLKRGDILLKYGDQEINTVDDLMTALKASKPKDEVKVSVQRGDAQKDVTVTLGDQNGSAYLGVVPFAGGRMDMMPMNPSRVMPYGASAGAVVAEVVSGGPADKAGLKKGDIILSVDGTNLDATHALADLIGGYKPGDKVKLSVTRAADAKAASPATIEVTLGENPDSKGKAYLGIQYSLPHMMGRRAPDGRMPNGKGTQPDLPTPSWPKGQMQVDIVVSQVVTDSPAAKAGIAVNDVIIKVDGNAVQSPQDVVSAVQSRKPGDKLTLVVKRDGADKELTATLGDNPDKKGTAWLGVSLSARMQTPATKSDGKEGSLPWSELHGQSL